MIQATRPLVFLCAIAGLAASLAAAPAATQSPVLPPKMVTGWNQYVDATQQRISGEMKALPRFLALDFGASAAADRAAVLAGGMPVSEARSVKSGGGNIDVSDGWVHHWRGAVLIPRATLDQVFARLQSSVPGSGQGDVLTSAILSRNGPAMRVFIKVQRQVRVIGTLTFVYNTEHDVAFTRRDAQHGSSTSVATKIAQLDDAGTPTEREFAHGDDHGFLWRWNSYWRYQQVAAGVIAECESLTLSRTAPFGLGMIASHFEKSEAPASMTRALVNLRQHFAAAGQMPHASSPVR